MPGTEFVNRTSDDFLAGAGFPADQDGGVGRGDCLDLDKNRAQSAALAMMEAADPSLAADTYYLNHRTRLMRSFEILEDLQRDLSPDDKGCVIDVGTWPPYTPALMGVFNAHSLVVTAPLGDAGRQNLDPAITVHAIDVERDGIAQPD